MRIWNLLLHDRNVERKNTFLIIQIIHDVSNSHKGYSNHINNSYILYFSYYVVLLPKNKNPKNLLSTSLIVELIGNKNTPPTLFSCHSGVSAAQSCADAERQEVQISTLQKRLLFCLWIIDVLRWRSAQACDHIPLAHNPESFSFLDILDNILQLLFGKHVEGLPGLYRCKLQRRQTNSACVSLSYRPAIYESVIEVRNKCLNWEQTSMLVAFSFSSITCFRIVRDDLMASFSVIDLLKKKPEEIRFFYPAWWTCSTNVLIIM